MGHRSRILLTIGAVLMLVLAACGGDDTDDDAASPAETDASTEEPTEEATEDATDGEEAAAEPRTVTIDVDGAVDGAQASLLGYFPNEATVRQGDTVEFAFQPGDIHTVTFGTLIDQAMSAPPDAEGPPPGAEKIPELVGPEGNVGAAAALPCFTDDDPPLDGACEQGAQPAFAGTASFYNSGVVEPQGSFSMEIAEDAAPGTYGYFCLVHGPSMSGTLTVVGADESAPTLEEIAATGDEQVTTVLEQAQPVLEATSNGTQPGFEEVFEQTDSTVLAGGGAETDVVNVDILEFGPEEISVEAGGTVNFNVFGFHTISFNAPESATPPIVMGEDGLPAANPEAFAPQGGAAGAPPPPEGPPPEGPPSVTDIDAGEWDGTGFFSSGVLASFPPALLSYDITFTTPGTYQFVCLIHPDMEGTVTVT